MTTPPIPPAMRKVAARALFEHDRTPDDPPWDDLTDAEAASYYSAVDSVLAAAFEVCEIREQTGHHNDEGIRDAWHNTWHNHVCPDATHRRLVITSPAEQVDTEGATT